MTVTELARLARLAADLKSRYEAAREARDALIREAYRAGRYQPDIAREAGLSTVMVGKVCRGVARGKVETPR